MKEPYATLWWSLMKANWQHWDKWKYGVKAKQGEAIYIGDDDAHVTVLAGTDGYHKTINRITGTHDQTVTTLDGLIEKCTKGSTAWDITPTILTALQWFKDNP